VDAPPNVNFSGSKGGRRSTPEVKLLEKLGIVSMRLWCDDSSKLSSYRNPKKTWGFPPPLPPKIKGVEMRSLGTADFFTRFCHRQKPVSGSKKGCPFIVSAFTARCSLSSPGEPPPPLILLFLLRRWLLIRANQANLTYNGRNISPRLLSGSSGGSFARGCCRVRAGPEVPLARV